MTVILCPDCVNDPSLGDPSYARWLGPDGREYCSIHFIRRFGHGERLVPIEGYEPPTTRKPPAPRRPSTRQTRSREVSA